jgi:hypothetical protein
MDIVAHMLWAGAATALVAQRRPVARRTAAAAVAFAAMPDVIQFLPLLGWVAGGSGPWTALFDHALATPGNEPALPATLVLLSHHLHCTLHSAVVAAAVTAAIWLATRSFWLPLLGWWSHIGIDVFSHSADFYAVPVLYPITYAGFDGIAWNEPWFIALNYAALAGVGLWLLRLRQIKARRRAGSNNDRTLANRREP